MRWGTQYLTQTATLPGGRRVLLHPNMRLLAAVGLQAFSDLSALPAAQQSCYVDHFQATSEQYLTSRNFATLVRLARKTLTSPNAKPVEDWLVGLLRGKAYGPILQLLAATASTDVATEDLEEEIGEELSALQDRFLRLQAEFDNYRKREARERSAAWARAKADLVQKLLGALDDLQRVAHFDPEKTSASAIFDGVSLVERKLSDTLHREGLTRIGEPGEPFDPHRHEAVAQIPNAAPQGTILQVARPGYLLHDRVVRPAQVVVSAGKPG